MEYIDVIAKTPLFSLEFSGKTGLNVYIRFSECERKGVKAGTQLKSKLQQLVNIVPDAALRGSASLNKASPVHKGWHRQGQETESLPSQVRLGWSSSHTRRRVGELKPFWSFGTLNTTVTACIKCGNGRGTATSSPE